jgi:hypothetical protein
MFSGLGGSAGGLHCTMELAAVAGRVGHEEAEAVA